MSMQHDEIRELIASYALDAVSPEEARTVALHLQDCAGCADEARSLRAAATEIAFAAPARKAPASLRATVLAAAERADARAAIPAPAAPRRSSTPWILAMAASFAAIFAGASALTLRLENGSLGEQLKLARAQAEAAQRALADTRTQLAVAQPLIRVATEFLNAPDIVRVDLKGESASPAASGRAFWSRTRGVLFTATSLPALPPNQVYQLWLVTTGGKPVSAGLLAPDADGRAIMVGQPAPGEGPAAFAVTVEPAGGVPSPTGPFALRGLL